MPGSLHATFCKKTDRQRQIRTNGHSTIIQRRLLVPFSFNLLADADCESKLRDQSLLLRLKPLECRGDASLSVQDRARWERDLSDELPVVVDRVSELAASLALGLEALSEFTKTALVANSLHAELVVGLRAGALVLSPELALWSNLATLENVNDRRDDKTALDASLSKKEDVGWWGRSRESGAQTKNGAADWANARELVESSGAQQLLLLVEVAAEGRILDLSAALGRNEGLRGLENELTGKLSRAGDSLRRDGGGESLFLGGVLEVNRGAARARLLDCELELASLEWVDSEGGVELREVRADLDVNWALLGWGGDLDAAWSELELARELRILKGGCG